MLLLGISPRQCRHAEYQEHQIGYTQIKNVDVCCSLSVRLVLQHNQHNQNVPSPEENNSMFKRCRLIIGPCDTGSYDRPTSFLQRKFKIEPSSQKAYSPKTMTRVKSTGINIRSKPKGDPEPSPTSPGVDVMLK